VPPFLRCPICVNDGLCFFLSVVYRADFVLAMDSVETAVVVGGCCWVSYSMVTHDGQRDAESFRRHWFDTVRNEKADTVREQW
jgi:hypothetical protein